MISEGKGQDMSEGRMAIAFPFPLLRVPGVVKFQLGWRRDRVSYSMSRVSRACVAPGVR